MPLDAEPAWWPDFFPQDSASDQSPEQESDRDKQHQEEQRLDWSDREHDTSTDCRGLSVRATTHRDRKPEAEPRRRIA